MPRRFVLTGAPGSGKTTLLLALGERGYPVVREAATDVISAEQARGVDAPWQQDDFIDRVVALQHHRQQRPLPAATRVQVFDRSPLCTLALARFLHHPVTALLADEVARVAHERVYEQLVFFVRPLGFLEPTAARRISHLDAVAFEAVHEQVYRDYGYVAVDVPAGSVAERADAVEVRLHAAHQRAGAGSDLD